MGLTFAPLGWIYHDGWAFNQTKTLTDGDDTIDASKHCHQRGHVHLFLPTVPFSKEGSSLAYWGQQTYTFKVVDEWGPNSKDSSQNQSVRLIGKPLWYFHVEEYWRRMYIQPWDMVDETCDLPLNQEITYTKWAVDEYRHWLVSNVALLNPDDEVIGTIDMHKSHLNGTVVEFTSSQLDGRNPDGSIYPLPGITDPDPTSFVGYYDYLTIRRRQVARRLFVAQDGMDEVFDGDADSDESIIDFLYGDSQFIQQFDDFYMSNASRYDGYVDASAVLVDFMRLHSISEKAGCRMSSDDGSILVPDDRTTGHVGIRYDASKPCHSLGPFVEGGEFYFFNTVVNRTLPLEYWLDDEGRVRQHWLKKTWAGYATDDDTSGGQTWAFSADSTKFHWVANLFSELDGVISDYSVDTCEPWTIGYFCTRRYPDIWHDNMSDASYHCFGMNAKRLKDDRSIQIAGEAHSDNSKVLHDRYAGTTTTVADDSDPTRPDGYYDENGWHPSESSSSSGGESHTPSIDWEKDGWTGWYEKGEIIRCGGEWYIREWAPLRYEPESRFHGEQPYWNIAKRQAFPNPTPSLCREYPSSSTGRVSPLPPDSRHHHFCTCCPYGSDEENRTHLLMYEYALYYGLVRRYPSNGSQEPDPSTLRRHLFMYTIQSTSTWHNTITDPILFVEGSANADGSYTPPHVRMQEILDSLPDDATDEDRDMAVMGFDPSISEENYIGDVAADIETLMEEAGAITPSPIPDGNGLQPVQRQIDHETESSVFSEWLSTLGSAWFTRYEDRDIIWFLDVNGDRDGNREISDADIIQTEDGTEVYIAGYDYIDYKVIPIYRPVPEPVFTVSMTTSLPISHAYEGMPYGDSFDGSASDHYSLQSHLTFAEFCSVWRLLDPDEVAQLKLDGDMPKRNSVPYGDPSKPLESIYPELSSSSSSQEFQYKQEFIDSLPTTSLNESAPSQVNSLFFPREDTKVRDHNATLSPNEQRYTPSPLDEVGDEIDQTTWDSMTKAQKSNYLRHYTETGDPIDPYRDGTVDPIQTWRSYFDHREVFTIPEASTAGGDSPPSPSDINHSSTPSHCHVHPRERSFHHEDGARRNHPDWLFQSPVIEYQKITHLDWQRLPHMQPEDDMMNATDPATSQPVWATDPVGDWGDGFEVTVQIPWTLDGEVQSPFSESDNMTTPPGTYCHDCVKPEDMLRHHIEFYDGRNAGGIPKGEMNPALFQMRRWDFPSYVGTIRELQATTVPDSILHGTPLPPLPPYDAPSSSSEQDWSHPTSEPLYHEDFNDYIHTTEIRTASLKDAPELRMFNLLKGTSYATWNDYIAEWWTEYDSTHHISQNPVTRLHDCNGNPTVENSFETLPDGSKMWREQTTTPLPDQKMVATTNGEQGYLDSTGTLRKGGTVASFNDPYPEHDDGKWCEQCLGAIVKARCVLILEDSLGHRWRQTVDATAMQPDQPIRGSDYDG